MVGGRDPEQAVAVCRVEGRADADRLARKLDDGLDPGASSSARCVGITPNGRRMNSSSSNISRRRFSEWLIADGVSPSVSATTVSLRCRIASLNTDSSVKSSWRSLGSFNSDMKTFQFIFCFISISIIACMNETVLKSSYRDHRGRRRRNRLARGNVRRRISRRLRRPRRRCCRQARPWRAVTGRRRSTPVAEAAAQAEIVLLTVPWNAVADALRRAGNLCRQDPHRCHQPDRDDAPRPRDSAVGFDTSGGEQVQALAPEAHVFKTFNQTGHEVMRNPRAFTPTTGDVRGRRPSASKQLVLSLVRDIGFEAVDAGPLASARLLEPLAMVWIEQAIKLGRGRDFAFTFASRT